MLSKHTQWKTLANLFNTFFQSFIKSARWWSSRQKVIEYPGYTPGHVRNETITAIRIYDHQLNGQTGYASILRGGVGYKNVTIRLYSGGAGRGFNFLVQIFGHWYLTFTKYAKYLYLINKDHTPIYQILYLFLSCVLIICNLYRKKYLPFHQV